MIRSVIRFTAILTLVIGAALPARAELNIQDITSPGGIKAWLVEEHSIPFVTLEIRFKGGTSLDLPGKRGATYMMSGLLEEGAGNLDAAAFGRAREELAADFSFSARRDSIKISAKFLRENQPAALELLRKAIEEPSFAQVAVDRVRAQVISIIAADKKDPNEIASATFDRLAYGDHPYATPSTGTVASVTKLTHEDLVIAYKNAMAKDRLYVSAVGDVTPKELGAMLDELLGGLPDKGSAMPPHAKITLTGGVTLIDLPTPQSVALFGHKGIKRDDPEFFAAFVMNQIFGAGGFTSRLTNEVREKRGLTYGVYSYLASYDLAELYMGSVASANDRIAQAIDVIRAEWVKMATGGATAQELDAAKKFLTGAYPLRFDGNGRIASILVRMQLDDLPRSYIKTRNDKVNAVTLEDVAKVAKRLLKPDDLRIVVVGKPEGMANIN
jgi:zinc protease